jgi:hypothetical protein
VRGFIGGFGLVIAALGASARAQTVQPGSVAESNPLINLSGTWVGGFTDSSGVARRGWWGSDTLIVKRDSSYIWTSLVDIAVDLRHLGRHKLKRLTATNVSWAGDTEFDSAGFDYKVEGDKLSLVSVKPDPNGGGKIYQAFWRVGRAAMPPMKPVPLQPPVPSPGQGPAPSGALANLVGTWIGGMTDSSGATYIGWGGNETLTFSPDSSYVWIRMTKGQPQRIMVNPIHPGDYR